MKILVVYSKTTGNISPFIKEQTDVLISKGIEIHYFFVTSKGFFGYLASYFKLALHLRASKYDIIHAHYGLCGFISSCQFKRPVITTFHGSDINEPLVKPISFIAHILSTRSIFVSSKLKNKLPAKEKTSIIPCGVNTDIFKPIDKESAKKELGLNNDKLYALFSSSFDNKIKNSELAISAFKKFPDIELLELKNLTREKVNLHFNACEFLILTSHNEGSPQVIKEAMACNCPIISVPVGDVEERIKNVNNSTITNYSVEEIEIAIKKVLNNNERTNGREEIMKQKLDLDSIGNELIKIYNYPN